MKKQCDTCSEGTKENSVFSCSKGRPGETTWNWTAGLLSVRMGFHLKFLFDSYPSVWTQVHSGWWQLTFTTQELYQPHSCHGRLRSWRSPFIAWSILSCFSKQKVSASYLQSYLLIFPNFIFFRISSGSVRHILFPTNSLAKGESNWYQSNITLA